MRILLVDDSEIDRALLRRCFSGHEVVEGESGTEGFELYCQARDDSNPFDLVVTDAAMLGGMGWELCRSIRQEDKETPIVLLSGSDEVARTHAWVVGARYVDKGMDTGCATLKAIIAEMEMS